MTHRCFVRVFSSHMLSTLAHIWSNLARYYGRDIGIPKFISGGGGGGGGGEEEGGDAVRCLAQTHERAKCLVRSDELY